MIIKYILACLIIATEGYQTSVYSLRIACLLILQLSLLGAYAQSPDFRWVKSFGTAGTSANGVSLALDKK